MDLSIFPVSVKALFSIVGSAALSVLLLQWLKQYITKPLWINLICLGINLAFLEVAAILFVADGTVAERAFIGVLLALGGSSLACYGYEVLHNALKQAGVAK